MATKEIKVMVSWTGENFNGGFGDPVIGAVVVAAPSLALFKKEFEISLAQQLKWLEDDGKEIPEFYRQGNYSIVYDLETSALLKEAESFTTLAAISRASGINAKQLSHYANGLKQPRESSRRKILQGIHQIGLRALAL
ncbi:MAG: hypothetical protein NC342_07670 [Pseudoflavonifractor sp.]|nr:CopG family transcriptional regulator [Alloprevotella sp.]MCM1117398.1 hypothetical protein [Pseudoflavonifractor sp.]